MILNKQEQLEHLTMLKEKLMDEQGIKNEEIISYKTHRFKRNPKEKELHNKFIKDHTEGYDMDLIVFGHSSTSLSPNDYLSMKEKRVVLSTIQWLGSSVGQSFLESCGFKLEQ